MHLENLAPLLKLVPLLILFAAALGGYLWFERGRQNREMRRMIDRERRYWLAELAYRARMRAKDWLSGTRTLRLTYQGPAADDRDPGPAKAEAAQVARTVAKPEGPA